MSQGELDEGTGPCHRPSKIEGCIKVEEMEVEHKNKHRPGNKNRCGL